MPSSPALVRSALAAALLALALPAAAQRTKSPADTATKSMLAQARFAPVGDIVPGVPVSGRLEAGDSILPDDSSFIDAYRYRGHAGERITVHMDSPDFDTFLSVHMGGQVVGVNDDGGKGTNSVLTIDLPLDAEYTVNANSLRAGMSGRYTLTLSTQGTTASVDTVNWARRYPGGGSPSDRYAVLVGIAQYPRALSANLDGPAQDVSDMRDMLVNRYGFKPENVLVLMNRDGNRRQILEAAQRHLGQAGPNGVAVFYYSGHGTQLDANYGQQDAEPDSKDEAIVVWGQGEDGGSLILDDELGAISDRLRAGRALFILDACHSGTGLRADMPHDAKFLRFARIRDHVSVPRDVLRSPAGERGVAGDLDARGGGSSRKRLLLTASTETEVSWISRGPWPDGVRSSVFTHYLAERMNAADSGLTFRQAMQQVAGETDRYTRKFQHTPQTPQAEGAHLDETIDAFLAGR